MSDASSRTRLLLGDEGVERLKGSYVLVLGAGGVGSHCIEALARAESEALASWTATGWRSRT